MKVKFPSGIEVEGSMNEIKEFYEYFDKKYPVYPKHNQNI